jgi:hypothetical protein
MEQSMSLPDSMKAKVPELRQFLAEAGGVEDGDTVEGVFYHDIVPGQFRHLTTRERQDIAVAFASALTWADAGFQRFRLTDSVAALFRLTSAPPIEPDLMPHRAFLVEVPGRYMRMRDNAGRWADTVFILVASLAGGMALVVSPDEESASVRMAVGAMSEFAAASEIDDDGMLAGRFAGNLVALLHGNGECAVADGRPARAGGLAGSVFTVRPPADVVVTRELRQAAADAASARSIGGVKRAMAHFVRGHWRNQPVGEGRKEIRRTWVKPHKRGDESLGRVVERITKLTGESL